MVPYVSGHAEVAVFRRVMMAHVPGAEFVEIRRRGSVRTVMDHMMHDTVPPVPEHHADGEAVRDIESQGYPRGQQNDAAEYGHTDPGRGPDKSQRRGVVKPMHGRKIGH